MNGSVVIANKLNLKAETETRTNGSLSGEVRRIRLHKLTIPYNWRPLAARVQYSDTGASNFTGSQASHHA